MNTNKKTPKLRFKGFTDEWEQCKLSDVADVRDGTHDSPKFYNDGFPLVTSKNLKGGSIDFSDCSFISEQDFNEINKRSKVDPGDILFGMIGTIGNPAIVEHTGFAIKNVALIKEGNIINNRFIYHLLSSKVFENYIARENAGGTQKFIALNQIRNFDFLAPALVEQNKIIELLDCISQNITLHQRKLEKLKLNKSALLQKLFPQNGCTIPEVRFKGFTDAWESRKLESLFTKYEDKVKTPNSGYWRLGLRSHCKGTFHTYVGAGNELETAEMNRVKSGNFILNITFAWERALAVTNDEDQDKLVSHRFPQFKPNSDLAIDFFKHTLMDKRFKHHLELSSPGGAGRNKVLKIADMLKYELLVPSIKEQNEISSFLNNVDYIIILHQSKLNRLISIKKALLQQLFV